MATLREEAQKIRARWKSDAEDVAARLTKAELEKVHRELVQESNAHAYEDVRIYINAVRAEYNKRFG